MTDTEKRDKVIKGIKDAINDEMDKPSCPYFEECRIDTGLMREVPVDMLDDALELLKAQEPMRVVTSEVRYKDHLSHCPSCGKALPNSGEYGKSNYCYKCGQAVKWE